MDCGVGSGCILVSCLHNIPNSIGIGIDISVDALMTAQKNAEKNNIGASRALFLECPFNRISTLWSGRGVHKTNISGRRRLIHLREEKAGGGDESV